MARGARCSAAYFAAAVALRTSAKAHATTTRRAGVDRGTAIYRDAHVAPKPSTRNLFTRRMIASFLHLHTRARGNHGTPDKCRASLALRKVRKSDEVILPSNPPNLRRNFLPRRRPSRAMRFFDGSSPSARFRQFHGFSALEIPPIDDRCRRSFVQFDTDNSSVMSLGGDFCPAVQAYRRT